MLAGRRDGNAQNRMINNITRLRENPLLRLMSCSWSTKRRIARKIAARIAVLSWQFVKAAVVDGGRGLCGSGDNRG